jgi:hypothetical protein
VILGYLLYRRRRGVRAAFRYSMRCWGVVLALLWPLVLVSAIGNMALGLAAEGLWLVLLLLKAAESRRRPGQRRPVQDVPLPGRHAGREVSGLPAPGHEGGRHAAVPEEDIARYSRPY